MQPSESARATLPEGDITDKKGWRFRRMSQRAGLGELGARALAGL